ncbi:hypothetical protein GGI04_005335, partial [Coemansia thaxteri]
MSANQGDSTSNELRSLSELGVQVVEQRLLEQSVRAQATRDLNERERETEHKRLVRVEIALDKRREQRRLAHESAAKAATSSERHRKAMAKAERLEAEIGQLESDRADIKRRIRDIEVRGSQEHEESAVCAKQEHSDTTSIESTVQQQQQPLARAGTTSNKLLSMLVPRRQAAVAAEKRRHGLELTDEMAGSATD